MYRTPSTDAKLQNDLDSLERKVKDMQKANEVLEAENKTLKDLQNKDLTRLKREAQTRQRWYSVIAFTAATLTFSIFLGAQSIVWAWLPLAAAVLVVLVIRAFTDPE